MQGSSRLRAMVVLVTALTLLLALLPTRPAYACSCAQMTMEGIAERDPDAAVVRIRRIDAGGSQGIGEVVDVLRGNGLPAELQLDLDDGGSCLPWVAVGDVAVLAFEPTRDGWRTMQCGMLDPATGLDEVTVDPAAGGPTALVLMGSFPGGDLIALDDQFRVQAVASAPLYVHRLLPCDGGVLAVGSDGEGHALVTRLDLPGLTPTDEYVAAADPELGVEHVDARCVESRVDLLLRVMGESPGIELHRDVFGDASLTMLPDSASAAFAGDVIAFVKPAGWGDGPMTVWTLDPDSGDRRRVLEHPAGGWELTASPDGRHVLIRGSAGGPMLVSIDLEVGRVVGESHGWWQPVQQPWVANDRILQLDENSGGIGGGGPARYRLVDLGLDTRHEFVGQGVRPLVAFPAGIVLGSADRVTVADAELVPVRHLQAPWVVGVGNAVLLDEVAPDPQAGATPLDTAPVGATSGGANSLETESSGGGAGSGGMPVAGVAVGLAAVLALAIAAVVRRRQA